ncbi:DNA-binding transcriptional LysR family regulator [Actinocorallia herbida]|uniref:DNA-binding transcriptional LysR family regulator n=1 Tax=Actinocorallia herbida TaxID=58109 RepID=A0A3N1DC00_9ACTN|nr:LysR family transcriptional regulator [Actinocorallia herbida]ROO91053.1 DNA-binding transcriptional LysR family regulator [Actinocorallia herbida]
MQLELRHLRTLCAIADAGSLSRAATSVGVSQPALTAQLHRIEESLGGQLFQRGRFGVLPTPFGQFVLTRARSVLLTVEELITGASSPENRATLRIGGYATPLLTGLVRRLFAEPDASITVHTEYSPRLLLDLLAAKRLDAAALVDYPGYEPPVPSSVEVRPIAIEPIHALVPAAHPLAEAAEIGLADLADEDWVLTPSDGVGWHEYVYTTCEESGFTPRVRHMMTEQPMTRTLVADHGAVTLCQATAVATPGVVIRPLKGAPLRLRHVVAWRTDGPIAHRSGEFVAMAVAAHEEASRRA